MAENNKAAIREKIVLEGELYLKSPLRIGSGESGEKEADCYVLKNRLQEPIIPGSSLGGVLRAEFKVSNSSEASESNMTEILFGSELGSSDKNKNQIRQSAVRVFDIVLQDFETEIRDGVAIDVNTGCAKDGSKHNYEAVKKDAHGKLRIEITIRREHECILSNIEEAIYSVAQMLVRGLRLGSLTSKGFGLVACNSVIINRYDFSKPRAVKAWFMKENSETKTVTSENAEFYSKNDFVVDMALSLSSSLLIRRETDEKCGELTIKAEQIQHRDKDGNVDYYIVPGTSVKGVLRHQAQKILRAVGQDVKCLGSLMGSAETKVKSRFIVSESYISPQRVREHVQPRNAIDRFTGGGISGRLFGEKPVWSEKAEDPAFLLHFEMKPFKNNKQRDWDIGLALFLIKDISTGKVTFGAEKSIGRGRVFGCETIIHYNDSIYKIDRAGKVEGNRENPAKELENFATSFINGLEE